MPGLPMTAVMALEMLSIVVTGLLVSLSGIFVIDNRDWSMMIVGGALVLIVCFFCSLMLWRLQARTHINAARRSSPGVRR
jgi:hypothetical protein